MFVIFSKLKCVTVTLHLLVAGSYISGFRGDGFTVRTAPGSPAAHIQKSEFLGSLQRGVSPGR